VNFVLHKPLTVLNVSRCFNAALGYMQRERRRYFRHAVKMPVTIVVGEKKIKASATNISEGGIALLVHHALPKNAAAQLQFSLPGTATALEVEAEVAWADLKGGVGLRFPKLPAQTQGLLESWLNEHGDQETPGAKEKLTGPGAALLQ
jgi:hypothetical protein